jgi:hypothetical protein
LLFKQNNNNGYGIKMSESIKSKTIPHFNVTVPKKSAFTIDTPPDIPKLHTLLVMSGKRGGGKGVAITTYVKQLLDLNLMDRVLLLSPTYWSNKTIFEPLGLDEEQDIIEPSKDSVKQVIKIVETEKDEYEEHIRKKKLYQSYKKIIKGNTPFHLLDPEMMMKFLELGFSDGPPQWKYPDDSHPPRIFLIIDDCMGTELMNPKSGLVSLATKHRHLARGLGISMAILMQSYSAIGGCPRVIRENCTLLCLFKCKDDNQIEKIHQEIGADIEIEKFDKLFQYATSKPYGFLTIDFSPKTPEQTFRSGWSEYITI